MLGKKWQEYDVVICSQLRAIGFTKSWLRQYMYKVEVVGISICVFFEQLG